MKIKKTYRLHSFLKGLGHYRHENGWESENRDLSSQGYVWPYNHIIFSRRSAIITSRPTGSVSVTTNQTQGVEAFQPRQGIQSRYAMTIINNSFYGNMGNP